MKVALTLIGLLALSGVALFFHQSETQNLQASNKPDYAKEVFQKYVQWKLKFNKNTNGQQDQYRFKTWVENMTFVEQHNKKDSKLTLGLNQFADLTNDEFRAIYTSEITLQQQQAEVITLDETNASSVNWVQNGAVTDIKNQGVCGSCWAFSTVAGLEGLMAITTGTLENLSEQQLTSCVPFPFSLGCKGGNPFFGYIYTAVAGIETAADYPYVQENNATTASCEYDESKVVFKNKGASAVTANSPTQLLAALQNQPLSVAIDAASIYFQLYSGGVLSTSNCGNELNHAVTLVAYNATDNYWTIKNSWGTSWGSQGYCNMANQEGDGVCGINMSPSYPTAN